MIRLICVSFITLLLALINKSRALLYWSNDISTFIRIELPIYVVLFVLYLQKVKLIQFFYTLSLVHRDWWCLHISHNVLLTVESNHVLSCWFNSYWTVIISSTAIAWTLTHIEIYLIDRSAALLFLSIILSILVYK